MPVNQQQIARELNLSVITVSRALRNHPDLAESTRARILQKAAEMGYRKSLSKRQEEPVSRRVGVLFYDGEGNWGQTPLDSGVIREIYRELQRECQRNRVETLIEMPGLDETPMLVKNKAVDALFLFGRYTPAAVARLGEIPALAVSSFLDGGKLPRIVADNFHGMREATEHLIRLGHREILFSSPLARLTQLFQERADGYVVAMHRHGLRPELYFHEPETPAAERFSGFSAAVCSCDAEAQHLHGALRARGMRIPDDFSLVAFDDLAGSRDFQLTTYAPDWALMGRLAASLLPANAAAIRGKPVVITVPGKLIVRGSTAPVCR